MNFASQISPSFHGATGVIEGMRRQRAAQVCRRRGSSRPGGRGRWRSPTASFSRTTTHSKKEGAESKQGGIACRSMGACGSKDPCNVDARTYHMDMEKEPPPHCSSTQDKLKSAPPPLPGVSTPSKRSSDAFLAEKAAVQQLLSSLSECRENSRQPSMTRAAAAAVRGPPLTAAEREAKEAERKAAAAKFKKEKAAMQERLRSPPIRDRGAYERPQGSSWGIRAV